MLYNVNFATGKNLFTFFAKRMELGQHYFGLLVKLVDRDGWLLELVLSLVRLDQQFVTLSLQY
jgi:hypothetical protein